MKLRFSLSTLVLAIATCILGMHAFASAEPPKKPSGPEAKAAAAKWLEGLGDKGLVLAKSVAKAGFTVRRGPSAVGPVTSLSYEQDGWWVTFTFRGELKTGMTAKELQAQFWHAALDRLPTPGLELPGWEVRPMTPVSSFEKGVEVLAYGDGKIKLRVKTKFFALYGRDPSVLVPADAPAPDSAYFSIRKEFPLDLSIEAPVK